MQSSVEVVEISKMGVRIEAEPPPQRVLDLRFWEGEFQPAAIQGLTGALTQALVLFRSCIPEYST